MKSYFEGIHSTDRVALLFVAAAVVSVLGATAIVKVADVVQGNQSIEKARIEAVAKCMPAGYTYGTTSYTIGGAGSYIATDGAGNRMWYTPPTK